MRCKTLSIVNAEHLPSEPMLMGHWRWALPAGARPERVIPRKPAELGGRVAGMWGVELGALAGQALREAELRAYVANAHMLAVHASCNVRSVKRL